MERMTEKSINLAMLVENGDSHMNADEDCGDNRLPLHSSLAPSSLLIMLQTNASVFGKLRDESKIFKVYSIRGWVNSVGVPCTFPKKVGVRDFDVLHILARKVLNDRGRHCNDEGDDHKVSPQALRHRQRHGLGRMRALTEGLRKLRHRQPSA